MARKFYATSINGNAAQPTDIELTRDGQWNTGVVFYQDCPHGADGVMIALFDTESEAQAAIARAGKLPKGARRPVIESRDFEDCGCLRCQAADLGRDAYLKGVSNNPNQDIVFQNWALRTGSDIRALATAWHFGYRKVAAEGGK